MQPRLDLVMIPWLVAVAVVTLAPHFDALPIWLPIGACMVIAWRGWLWRQGRLNGPKILIIGLAVAGTIGIATEYRTIFGREPGVALLVLLMSLKLMELSRPRDAVVVVMLGYFLLLTHYFHADSIAVGIWMLIALTVATATLIRLQAPHAGRPIETLKRAGILIFQAMPIMAVLFVLFPRISGPLWGLPQDAQKATTGLSDSMAPGSIGELSQSRALAFRAEFKGAAPARDLLYWRGPVMTDYDGRAWRVAPYSNAEPPRINPLTPAENASGVTAQSGAMDHLTEYVLTLEPHQQRWLLALDLPIKRPPETLLTATLSVVSKTPVRDRLRLEFTSLTRYRAGTEESPAALRRALALPREINPRSRELATEWQAQSNNPYVIAAKALTRFQQENFVYTLKPPLLGRDAVDEFLFESKRGFCEHFASSFVFLMRAAGVPARVVAGYLGGEANPIDGHFAIRQSDAHAWAEIWIAGEGWRRIDPTASIAPNRIEQGLQAALPAGEALPSVLQPDFDWLRTLRYRWDAIDYAWNRWILGYDEARQRDFLKRLGIGNDWQTLIALLATLTGLLVIALTLWITRRQKNQDRAKALWQLAGDAFAKRGVAKRPDEGPQDYAQRISRERPALAGLALNISSLYIRLQYGAVAGSDRQQSLNDLTREVGTIAPRWKLWRLRF